MPVDQLLNLEKGNAHFNTQVFYLLATGDDAAVIVAEHCHRLANQIGPEHTLTAHIEVVAINQGDERLHYRGWMTLVTTPQTTISSSSWG